jgi:uncharacterized sulfatase
MENLAGNSEHRETLQRLRKVLYTWMLQVRDVGLLPEAEMHIRAEGLSPYEMARDPGKFPQRHILDAASLVGQGSKYIPRLIRLLDDSDSAVRYWAVIALTVLGSQAEPATDALVARLEDSSPNVRFAAAGALCKLGRYRVALQVLAEGLEDEREETVLHAAREIEGFGEKARPIVAQIEQARERCRLPDGTYRNNNHATFIDWALKYALENCGQ